MENPKQEPKVKRVRIKKNGPYIVEGDVPLVHKSQVVSEYGEPLTWKKEKTIPTEGEYHLCRCGQSKNKPFCDGTHKLVNFDGTETAATTTNAQRRRQIPGGTNISVQQDASLCMDSGFCGTRNTNIRKLVPQTQDTQLRSLMIAMIERCPSGTYTYSTAQGEPDIEPSLPQEMATTTEITSDGPIEGSLWLTGNVPVERSDGQPFETRNRVTLCCCGQSRNKPLCDGTHRRICARKAREAREAKGGS